MTAQITIETTGSATTSGYKVTWVVTSAVDMPEEVFVYTASSDKYSHVASPSDLVFPTTRDVLVSQYRRSTAEYTYETIIAAEAAKTNVASAIEELVNAYKAQLSSFLTTSSTSFGGI